VRIPLFFLSAALCVLPLTLPGANAPTILRTAAPFLASNSIEVTWEDNSHDEDGFEVQFSPDGSTAWATLSAPIKNQTLVSSITGGASNATFFFRVRAKSTASGDSDWTQAVPVTLPTGIAIQSGTFVGSTEGQALTINPPPTAGNPPSSWSASNLPSGLSVNSATGVISGPAPPAGLYRPKLSFTDGATTTSTFITLRSTPATSGPVEINAPADQVSLTENFPLVVDLNTFFTDPDTTRAVRIPTNLGNIDTILYENATPATVENFLNYVDDGDYDDVIFHRSVTVATAAVDVVQSGRLRANPGGDYSDVPLDPQIIDEPGQSNIRGTIAMAKGSSPNTAAAGWYFNINPNTGLDSPSAVGGFTVFGRASTPSLAVIDDIWSRPTGNYTVEIGGNPGIVPNWPTTVVPAGPVPAPNELIQIASITYLNPLAYSITASSNPALGTATISGSECTFDRSGNATGATTLSIDVTDLDGNSISSSMTVCVLSLDTVPGLSPGGSLSIAFDHEKNIPGLVYKVQRSTGLNGWTTIWETSDGTGAPEVISVIDLGSRWRLTVEDTASTPPSPRKAFLRVLVSKPE
jgi:cyclophilin family peptidyl-prolyl cis-trans isomerase